MIFLRAVLAITGLGVVALGLNIGLGGIETLGWQAPGAFINVTDPALFAVRDSHVRFLGGLWFGAGLVFLAGAYAPRAMRAPLLTLIAMIGFGAAARLSANDAEALYSVAPSLAAEAVLFPLLGWWIAVATRRAGT